MTKVRSLYLPPLYQDTPESGRIILRDGTIATIKLIQAQDKIAVKEFFKRLSPESRYSRFFSMAGPDEVFLTAICTPEPQKQLGLQVSRMLEGAERIIAVGSYHGIDEKSAEVAMAVDDAFQGKGIGTHLLERLSLLAVRNGFLSFRATTHFTNQPMLEVFRHSGFHLTEKQEDRYVQIDFPVIPTKESSARSEMLDRVFTNASLLPFFRPKSVAVIGASRNPSSIGYKILSAIVKNGFQGPVYPVNPSAKVVYSIRAYASMRDLPEPVDLAVVSVPLEKILNVVDDCAANGVRALVVITAGFAELGEVGRQLQTQLTDKVRGYGMRMVGPNCMGLINTAPDVQLNASFSMVYPLHGRVAMSSQSGALGIAVLEFTKQRNMGLSTFVSVGNKADVSGNDLLQYWEEDPDTDVILLYLESFGNPRRFARIARRVSRSKPIIAVKSGRTKAGGRAAGSHTAALAASDVAVEALFHQTGVIRANTLEEMFDLAAAFGSQPLPAGNRVGILTNAGGPGILCADTCEANQLEIPELSEQTRSLLKRFLPPAASVVNPVDMIASAPPEHYQHAIEILLKSGEIDALIVIYIPVVMDTSVIFQTIANGVEAARKSTGGGGKPVYACLMSEESSRSQIKAAGETVPTYLFPESAAYVLGKVSAYAGWRRKTPGLIPDLERIDPATAKEICRKAIAERGSGWLTPEENRTLLAAMELPLPSQEFASTADEAAAVARKIGFPVAIKLVSKTLIHKTEIGGVVLNIQDEHGIRTAFDGIQSRLKKKGSLKEMDGVLVQEMISGGTEVMIGVAQDPSFGPLIGFGLGGIHVEILKDITFRITPLTDLDAREMVRSIKGYRLLEGYRDRPPADIKALENALLKISRLVEEVPEISELDLNPIFAMPPGKGCKIADARIHVQPSGPSR
jgi:acetate---CoA ligase (ADP-forming)